MGASAADHTESYALMHGNYQVILNVVQPGSGGKLEWRQCLMIDYFNTISFCFAG
ncbi:hypothetical protein [Endozoicomonas sp. GU-1]|uniref:hypothetical protein n=1 Tax=Endozoicomonas sp. GU-1 TaxID=3009078 RepID=UPI0022B36EEB|nr:hypothetical protein [Endozoicomonas sp. GU-1]WBA88335.1 hypothetical protein O3276_10255 [Endozoicomonas sp. GU-1]